MRPSSLLLKSGMHAGRADGRLEPRISNWMSTPSHPRARAMACSLATYLLESFQISFSVSCPDRIIFILYTISCITCLNIPVLSHFCCLFNMMSNPSLHPQIALSGRQIGKPPQDASTLARRNPVQSIPFHFASFPCNAVTLSRCHAVTCSLFLQLVVSGLLKVGGR